MGYLPKAVQAQFQKMSYSLLCGPLCDIYDHNSQYVTNANFDMFPQVRDGPSYSYPEKRGTEKWKLSPAQMLVSR